MGRNSCLGLFLQLILKREKTAQISLRFQEVLVDTDGKPLWDGKSAGQVREATAAEHSEWKRSRDQAISDGEIDLDARDDPDNWNVYLMGAPKNKVRRNG